MTPKEDKIIGAFLEFPLALLEGVPTYEYMTNLNVYLYLCFVRSGLHIRMRYVGIPDFNGTARLI